MTIVSATDHVITLDGTDISAWVHEVQFDVEFETKDKTSYGDSGKRTKTPGLEDGSVTIACHNDYGNSALDGILWGVKNTLVDIVAKPASGSVSATNPSYTATVHINKLTPIAAKVGDIPTQNLTFPVSGGTARATA